MSQPKRAIYANIFCPTLHYPAVDYILDIKSYLKKGDKLYLCFWDQEVYPFQRFGDYLLSNQTADQKIKEVVKDISTFLTAQGVNHEIVFMSDAFKRILNDEQLNDLLFFILSKVSVGHLEDIYEHMKYLAVRPVTISKIVYMISDYLIAVNFPKLFPELSPIEVTDFYTGERFKAVIAKIEEAITEKGFLVTHPKIIYAKPIPILNYSSGNWISIMMSRNEIEREIRKAYAQKVNYSQAKDLLLLLTKLLGDNGFAVIKEGKMEKTNIQSLQVAIAKLNDEDAILTMTENIHRYINKVRASFERSSEQELKKINYIRDPAKLKSILNILSPSKMEILKLCDGTHTIPDIIRQSPMKESSTRSYLSRLKAQNIITGDPKPRRKVDEVLISFN